MKTTETKIGTVAEWQEDHKVFEKILEKQRNINTEYDWSDDKQDLFIENSIFDIDEILFSGFWSQGDGASFTGKIDIIDYLYRTKQLTKYSALVRAINQNKLADHVNITRISSRYLHENTCEVEDIEQYEDITNLTLSQASDLEEELEQKRLDQCREIYQDLKKTYEYLTSEEAIIDTLEANDYMFNESGEMVQD